LTHIGAARRSTHVARINRRDAITRLTGNVQGVTTIMKKLAFPLVAAFALAACATTPAESTVPSPTASASTAASGLPLHTQPVGLMAVDLNTRQLTVGTPLDYWIAFSLDGSPSDWTFTFSDPSILEFHADGVTNEVGSFAGAYTLKAGETTVTATNVATGDRVEMIVTVWQ